MLEQALVLGAAFEQATLSLRLHRRIPQSLINRLEEPFEDDMRLHRLSHGFKAIRIVPPGQVASLLGREGTKERLSLAQASEAALTTLAFLRLDWTEAKPIDSQPQAQS